MMFSVEKFVKKWKKMKIWPIFGEIFIIFGGSF